MEHWMNVFNVTRINLFQSINTMQEEQGKFLETKSSNFEFYPVAPRSLKDSLIGSANNKK